MTWGYGIGFTFLYISYNFKWYWYKGISIYITLLYISCVIYFSGLVKGKTYRKPSTILFPLKYGDFPVIISLKPIRSWFSR